MFAITFSFNFLSCSKTKLLPRQIYLERFTREPYMKTPWLPILHVLPTLAICERGLLLTELLLSVPRSPVCTVLMGGRLATKPIPAIAGAKWVELIEIVYSSMVVSLMPGRGNAAASSTATPIIWFALLAVASYLHVNVERTIVIWHLVIHPAMFPSIEESVHCLLKHQRAIDSALTVV